MNRAFYIFTIPLVILFVFQLYREYFFQNLKKEEKLNLEIGMIGSNPLLVLQLSQNLLKTTNETERQKELNEEKQIMDLCWPVFNYTVKTFETMLAEISTKSGDKLFSDFTELPTVFSSGMYVANMTNSLWKFNISIIRMKLNAASPPHLRILSKHRKGDISLDVTYRNEQIVVDLNYPKGLKNNRQPILNYQKAIDEALQNLITAQAKIMPLSKH